MTIAFNKDLSGKVAIITGAARNMGRAFAVALAGRGADVVVHYHSKSSEIDAKKTAQQVTEAGARTLLVKGDLSKPKTTKQIFEETLEIFGRVDIVINNAGVVIKRSIMDYTEEDFDLSFNVNAKAAFLVMQQASRHLSDDGRVISMGTSLLGAFTGMYGAYAGSKAPLEDFTRALAKEVGARGITANVVAPGPVDTAFFHGEENEQSTAYLKGASVQNRLGKINDIVPMINFLVGEEAGWVTGQTLFVNGGFVAR